MSSPAPAASEGRGECGAEEQALLVEEEEESRRRSDPLLVS